MDLPRVDRIATVNLATLLAGSLRRLVLSSDWP